MFLKISGEAIARFPLSCVPVLMYNVRVLPATRHFQTILAVKSQRKLA